MHEVFGYAPSPSPGIVESPPPMGMAMQQDQLGGEGVGFFCICLNSDG